MGAATITEDSAAYVVAEIGANHQGDVETARKDDQAAALAGADAVKFQKRDNQALFTPEATTLHMPARMLLVPPTVNTVKRWNLAKTSTSSS